MTAEIIRYGFARTSVAALLVATSGKGLVAVLMREHPNDAAMAADLADRHPDAELARDNPAVRHAIEAVIGFVERPKRNIDLPVDIRATAFAARASVRATVTDLRSALTRRPSRHRSRDHRPAEQRVPHWARKQRSAS